MKGLILRKSIKLLPGVRLNISKSGLSLSLGPKGARVTTGQRGTHLHLDLPGSGLYYRRKLDANESDNNKEKKADEALPEIAGLQRLTTAPKEVDFVDGLRALHEGREDDAYTHAPTRRIPRTWLTAHFWPDSSPSSADSFPKRPTTSKARWNKKTHSAKPVKNTKSTWV
jgi:hypothetical protein